MHEENSLFEIYGPYNQYLNLKVINLHDCWQKSHHLSKTSHKLDPVLHTEHTKDTGGSIIKRRTKFTVRLEDTVKSPLLSSFS